MEHMQVEVLEIKLLPRNGGPLKAFASVKVGDWTIHDWRIIQQSGHRVFVSVPQVSWKDDGGTVRYKALLTLPGEMKQRIDIAILSAWEREKNGDQTPR